MFKLNLKLCKKCNKLYPCTPQFFHRNSEYGLSYYCKICMNNYNHRYRKKEPYHKILNNYEKGFLSAALDTDGGVYIYKMKRKHFPYWQIIIKMAFYNNSIQYLDKIQQILGTNNNYVHSNKNKCLTLAYYSNTCRVILPQIELVIKEGIRKKALKMLELLEKGKNKTLRNEEYRNKLLNIYLNK